METAANIFIGLVFFLAIIGLISTILFFRNLKKRIQEKRRKKQEENRIKEDPIRLKKRNIEISYTDGLGETTTREINTVALYPQAELVKAFCLLRMDYRTFRLDRINTAKEIDTGTPIENLSEYLNSIQRG